MERNLYYYSGYWPKREFYWFKEEQATKTTIIGNYKLTEKYSKLCKNSGKAKSSTAETESTYQLKERYPHDQSRLSTRAWTCTVTEKYCIIYSAVTVIWPYQCAVFNHSFNHLFLFFSNTQKINDFHCNIHYRINTYIWRASENMCEDGGLQNWVLNLNLNKDTFGVFLREAFKEIHSLGPS